MFPIEKADVNKFMQIISAQNISEMINEDIKEYKSQRLKDS